MLEVHVNLLPVVVLGNRGLSYSSPGRHRRKNVAPRGLQGPPAQQSRAWAEGLPSHPEKTSEHTFLNNSPVETMTKHKK